MVKYINDWSYSVGFITSEQIEIFNEATGEDLVSVFMPTTPNPTNGFLILMTISSILELDYPVSLAVEFVVSMGIIGATKEIFKSYLGKRFFFIFYIRFFLLKCISIRDTMIIITIHNTGYARFMLNSGMYLKFIQYNHTINVSGINIVPITVSTFMTSFILLFMFPRYISRELDIMSFDVSIVSMICIV